MTNRDVKAYIQAKIKELSNSDLEISVGDCPEFVETRSPRGTVCVQKGNGLPVVEIVVNPKKYDLIVLDETLILYQEGVELLKLGIKEANMTISERNRIEDYRMRGLNVED